MAAGFERRVALISARVVLTYVLAGLATWGGFWLLLALVRPEGAEPPLRPFFLAMLPVMALLLAVPMWALGGTLVVSATPERLSVRRDRWFSRGVPVEVTLAGRRPVFTALAHPQFRRRRAATLTVNVGGESTRLADGALLETLSALADELDAYYSTTVSTNLR